MNEKQFAWSTIILLLIVLMILIYAAIDERNKEACLNKKNEHIPIY